MTGYDRPDCNRCATTCGASKREQQHCKYVQPKEGWMLAELALGNPQGLHNVLSQLPFEVKLDFYLRS